MFSSSLDFQPHDEAAPIGVMRAMVDAESYKALPGTGKLNDEILTAVPGLDNLGASLVIHPCTIDSDRRPSASPSTKTRSHIPEIVS